MSKVNDEFAAYREWDVLARSKEFQGPFDGVFPVPGTDTFSIMRDSDYNLIGEFTGKTNPEVSQQVSKLPWPPSFDKSIRMHYGQVNLYGCSLRCVNYASKQQYGAPQQDTNGFFDLDEIQFANSANDKDELNLQEWCLNGPLASVLLNRVTTREKLVRYSIMRDQGVDNFESNESKRSANDHIIVENDGLRFLVATVHSDFPPDWSQKLSIEYRPQWGGVPTEVDRDSIREVIGFMLGRPLVKIGETSLMRQGFIAKYSARSHGVQNIKHVCSRPGNPPFRLTPLTHATAEGVIQRLLPRYMEIRNNLPLSVALSRCWASQTLPLGLNILVLATALECLVDAWFRLPSSKSKGSYIPKKIFNSMLQPEIESLSAKLHANPAGAHIVRRIIGANQFGAIDKMEMFLDEIGLQFGECEKKLLRSRNKYAHGAAITTAAEKNNASNNWLLYLSLFNRVVLKLLSCDGVYTDHSGKGSPDHSVEEAMIGDISGFSG